MTTNKITEIAEIKTIEDAIKVLENMAILVNELIQHNAKADADAARKKQDKQKNISRKKRGN